ncbi:peptide-binding protein [Psychromarinibacter sp. C21-152]|uniref:Peptide-binding protein n=1 Tax=Psychromarinibacter sediminicola TaxID=3033385 RepID=A0AAE3NRB2_9RHOB|nr:SH3 domain-containing protein [Psychromarinibacter sediminicola]MDF0599520.1 peptide-binding protein [Psychromarinibacter sediminicola]
MKFLATAAFLLAAAAVQAQPAYYRVTGVAADDTLNVRAEPSASSADIGDLPPNAEGIEVIVTDASGDWGRIVWQEGNAWISMHFLAPQDLPAIADTALPAGLQCGGTEPFWGLNLSGTSGVYSDISGTNLSLNLTNARVAEGLAQFPVALSLSTTGAGVLATIQPALCGDGMSDRDYPYSLTLFLETGQGRRFLAGCCSLPLEAGSN